MDEKIDAPVSLLYTFKLILILMFTISFTAHQYDVGDESLHVSESKQSNWGDQFVEVKHKKNLIKRQYD